MQSGKILAIICIQLTFEYTNVPFFTSGLNLASEADKFFSEQKGLPSIA